MKRLSDDKEVLDSIYYYLLDFNERNDWQYMIRILNKTRLCDLTLSEFKMLFLYATSEDYKNL